MMILAAILFSALSSPSWAIGQGNYELCFGITPDLIYLHDIEIVNFKSSSTDSGTFDVIINNGWRSKTSDPKTIQVSHGSFSPGKFTFSVPAENGHGSYVVTGEDKEIKGRFVGTVRAVPPAQLFRMNGEKTTSFWLARKDLGETEKKGAR